MRYPSPSERPYRLVLEKRRKMARSAHAYVRGATVQFYRWVDEADHAIPEGAPICICGDCHLGNLDPVADSKGRVFIQIRISTRPSSAIRPMT